MTPLDRAQLQPDTSDSQADRVPGSVWAYIALVTVVAAACLAYFSQDFTLEGWQGLLVLVLVAIIFERVGLQIYGETHVSAGVVALFAIAILYGPADTAVVAPVIVLAAEAFTRSRWYQRVFDGAAYTLASVSAALVFQAFIDIDGALTIWWIPAALLAIAVNYSVNIPLVSIAITLSTGDGWLAVWREKYQWLLPYYLVFGLFGLALAAAYLALGVAGILAFVVPPFMMRFALRQYLTKTEQTVLELKQKNAELEAANRDIMQMTRQLTETYDGTLEALVLALDARDRETKGHSLRVSSYVTKIAERLGIAADSPAGIEMQRGALLHDVGKIGVSDYILHKPGPLTPEEWDDMKRHPGIGYSMLRDISFLSGAAAIVHAHHERYDGKGYPNGLAGEELPIGARIFAVADTFDAMTSDRPYRQALPYEVSREEILRHSGTQFDPQVVQAFLLVYDEMVELAQSGHDAEAEALEDEQHARAA